MVDLKRTKEEIKEKTDPCGYDPEIYPVSMYLSDDEVEKLGLEKAEVGKEMLMAATVKVTSISRNEHAKDKKRHSATLTVMEAELKEKPASRTKAEVMFGE